MPKNLSRYIKMIQSDRVQENKNGIDICYYNHIPKMKYDLIFIDPPYKTNMLEDTLIKLQSLEYLSNADYLYFEQQKDVNNSRCVNLINNDFEVVKNLSIGDVSYTIAKKR